MQTFAVTMSKSIRDDSHANFLSAYEAHKNRVYAWCQRYSSGDPEWAKDLCHDVFVRLLESFPKLDTSKPLGGWLYAVTTNLALTRLRHQRTFATRVMDAIGRQPPIPSPAPDTLLDERETAAVATRALQALPPQERVVVTMLFVDGKNQQEISETLNLSKGYVSKLVARAQKRLRAAGWEVDDVAA